MQRPGGVERGEPRERGGVGSGGAADDELGGEGRSLCCSEIGHCAILVVDLRTTLGLCTTESMSYKLDLNDLDREGGSLTAQLAERIAADIESGALAPGAKLPTTRELSAAASINHLTAARVYRRLAEQGYVAAHVGRGTFVRTHPPVERGVDDEDWQVGTLPPRQAVLRRADARRVAGHGSRRDPAGHRLRRRRAAAHLAGPRAGRRGHARRRRRPAVPPGRGAARAALAAVRARRGQGLGAPSPRRSSSPPARVRRSTSSPAPRSGPGTSPSSSRRPSPAR